MSCTIFSTFFSVQPFAVSNCSTPLKVKNGDDVLCLCSSKGGNPSPTALWYKWHRGKWSWLFKEPVIFEKYFQK